jgi:DNA-binding response OmpR family regulator
MGLFFTDNFVVCLPMKDILILEDDLQLQSILTTMLSQQHHCYGARTLADAYQQLEKHAFDLVLVDRKLPDGDGLEILGYIHDMLPQTKLLALTSQAKVEDRVVGLEQGADDYLAKPFSMAELKLRIQKLLQMERKLLDTVLRAGDLTFSPKTGVVTMPQKSVQLRRREAQILECLLRYKNQVVPRSTLIKNIWSTADLYPTETTLDVYIRRIRVQLEIYSNYIVTVRGFGYRFSAAAEGR